MTRSGLRDCGAVGRAVAAAGRRARLSASGLYYLARSLREEGRQPGTRRDLGHFVRQSWDTLGQICPTTPNERDLYGQA